MTVDQFIEQFELFADAPGAVERLRGLILELAVTGQLVRARPVDGEDLVASLTAQRKRLESLREIRVRDTVPVEADEHRCSVPTHWSWLRLAHVGYELGQREPKERFTYIDVGGIDSDTGVVSDRVEIIDPADAPSRARKIVKKGTVIYSTVRPYLRNVAIIEEDYKPDPIASTAFGILFPFDGVDARYLFFWLRSRPFNDYVEDGMKGMAYPAINDEKFYAGPIPLPPLAEQKRIAAKVDELMGLCDRLETQQQEREQKHAALSRAALARFAKAPTPSNLEYLFHDSYTIDPADLRKSILSMAVRGKLEPQSTDDEDVNELLAKNDQRRKLKAAKDHRADNEPQPLLSADDRWEIPSSWAWRGLADLVLFVDYRGKTPTKTSSGVRLITAKNVRKGAIDLSPEEFVSEREYVEWMTRGFPRVGDILFTTEAPMGNAAVINLEERFALAQRVICFQSYGAVNGDFLVLQILSEDFQSILDKNGTGVTAKGIKAAKLKQLPLAVPPIAEQRRIVAKMDELMALVDRLAAQQAEARSLAARFLDAAVAELTNRA